MAKKTVIKIDFTPHKYQKEFFDAWKRFNLCICTRGWGKTVLAVNALIIELNTKHAEPRSFGYVAPKKGQAKDITWSLFRLYLAPLIEHGIVNMKTADLEIVNNRTGNIIKLYGADDGNDEVIRGKTLAGVVVDEFDGIKMSSWLEIIRPTLRTHKGWALLIGTIKPGGNLIALRDENVDSPDWNIKKYPFSECWEELPAYDQDEHDSILSQFRNRPNEFAREYECDENADGQDNIIPMSLISAARGQHLPESAYSRLVKVMGVDVATGGGNDNSSICMRHGLVCGNIEEYDVDNMTLATIVANKINTWKPDAVFVDKGRGEGVISRLRQLGYTVIGVDFGGKAARDDLYMNKRTEMYFGIKNWLEGGGVLPDDDKLCQELATPILIPCASEKFMMERKDKIRERLKRSPDKGDALALTFAAPVQKRSDRRHSNNNHKTISSSGYSPIGHRRQKYGFFR
jgi:hypothetical protein